MYKIYINETPLFLLDADKHAIPDAGPQHLVARYTGMQKILLNYADMLEKTNRFEAITLYAEDYEQLVSDFHDHYREEVAAGGVVENPEGQILAIFRRGYWDLPKGKIDTGEQPAEAARREVEEETGIAPDSVGSKVGMTYHTYREGSGKRVLKKTHWFAMQAKSRPPTPQTSEDIELSIWIAPADLIAHKRPIYRSILDLLEARYS